MWIMLNDAFFSIVHKDCRRDELLVRARRAGDIQKVFPRIVGAVRKDELADYLFRATVKIADVREVIAGEIARINYGNFKDSVEDDDLHRAYLQVWHAMATLQPPRRSLVADPTIPAPAVKAARATVKSRRKK